MRERFDLQTHNNAALTIEQILTRECDEFSDLFVFRSAAGSLSTELITELATLISTGLNLSAISALCRTSTFASSPSVV